MHIPDGYLSPAFYGGFWAAMAPAWAYASRRTGSLTAEKIPHVALASVFCLLAMTFAIPLPGGTTTHLQGTALVAILLGPWSAVMAVSVALAIQGLLFGDGGITVLAVNAFNMALAGSLCAGAAYPTIRRVLSGMRAIPLSNREALSAGTAAYLSVNISALLTAVELGLQSGVQPAYFPYGLKVTVPAVMLVHLTVAGFLEAGMTAMAMLAIQRQSGHTQTKPKEVRT